MSTMDDNSCSSRRINLQHVFKTYDFGTHAYFEACAPLANRRVDCTLFNAVSDFCQNAVASLIRYLWQPWSVILPLVYE